MHTFQGICNLEKNECSQHVGWGGKVGMNAHFMHNHLYLLTDLSFHLLPVVVSKAASEMQTTCNANLSLVTNCMEHALTAVHPHTRYSAGWDAKLFFLPLSYLPTWMPDSLFNRSYPKPELKN